MQLFQNLPLNGKNISKKYSIVDISLYFAVQSGNQNNILEVEEGSEGSGDRYISDKTGSNRMYCQIYLEVS